MNLVPVKKWFPHLLFLRTIANSKKYVRGIRRIDEFQGLSTTTGCTTVSATFGAPNIS